MTPLTQMLAAAALSAVIAVALWQSSSSGVTVGNFVAFVTAMLMLVTPIRHLAEIAGPITRGLAALERGLDLIETRPNSPAAPTAPTRGAGRDRPAGTCGCATRPTSDERRDDEQPAALRGVSCRCARRGAGAGGPFGLGQDHAGQPAAAVCRGGRGQVRLTAYPCPTGTWPACAGSSPWSARTW
jgi:ATP-binding cassette, subfamily B, bacterial MsbA